ncbi:RNA polymerase-associated protein RapA [Arenimonas terrae]|uniref:RNA polymerase-associated protein RapA n=1 Tax=Arenimonas terrae TaxID=2546226 RepID=A0A5C4RVT3_9GAMM|nr:RNA polymerase-associated protein RapA [Arenimonas terrae]TNJ35280.1 RNA polymerase-associated protein RapA [Arenimonas terrae]
MNNFAPGQRWFSSAEPELGLGTVLRLAGRQVQIVFTGTGVVRMYALGSAPLLRAVFRPGERVRIGGADKTVERAELHELLIHYTCDGQVHPEGELDAEQPVSQADSRLLSGRVDRNDQFEFRRECLQRRAEARAHAGWGVLGARIDLIPHQLRVAAMAGERRPPRLLLADEVGLGKTIEACLIAAQQLATGRARRVLVLVPESLVNQWFVELLRRFNLPFAIYDEERCESLELTEPKANPFEDEQCVIASVDWLASHEKRARQALAAGWDLLLVDEAHHLVWTPEFSSPGYALVEALALRTPGLLLLTATPEQLGLGGHFARLRLLDPARYTDLEAFRADARGYLELSALAERLLDGQTLTTGDMQRLAALFPDEGDELARRLGRIAGGDEGERDALLADLVDRHGTGRVMVRNRRAGHSRHPASRDTGASMHGAVGGFPRRLPAITALPDPDEPTVLGRLRAEFAHDVGETDDEPSHDYARDPRTDWLLGILDAVAPAKVLLLCRSRAKVQALEEALRLRSGLQVARFHEDMNLLQRDRNAAFFADPEGARLLIASEIGAEGRNFQFAQHLVMWDLPLHPDMLEQRIGRLDRIGQRGDVVIHAAAVPGSAQEVLLRWVHEGLDAFRGVLADGRELLRAFGAELLQLAAQDADAREPALTELIERSREKHAELARIIAEGRDRLLELGSRGSDGGELLAALQEDDRHAGMDDHALRLLEQFGVHNEPLAAGLWLLDPEHVTVDGFEELKNGPRTATFDRATALARDDLLYLRADHPLLLSAGELLVSGETGNAAFLVDDSLPPRTVVLEAVNVLECVAPAGLDIERYLPPAPLSVAVDTRLQVRADFAPGERARLRAGDRVFDLSPQRKILAALVPPMLERAREETQAVAQARIAEAIAKADTLLSNEAQRLRALARVNPAVRPEEIAALEKERESLLAILPTARPRLDSLRLVASTDFLQLRR